jgi:hypothetical protein
VSVRRQEFNGVETGGNCPRLGGPRQVEAEGGRQQTPVPDPPLEQVNPCHQPGTNSSIAYFSMALGLGTRPDPISSGTVLVWLRSDTNLNLGSESSQRTIQRLENKELDAKWMWTK